MFNQKKQGVKIPLQIKTMSKYINTQLTRIPTEAGESIEEVLRRLTMNKEPIPENVPPIYTAKEDGVIGDYDIRHDRFDTAYEAKTKFDASEIAKAAEIGKENNQQQEEQPKNE